MKIEISDKDRKRLISLSKKKTLTDQETKEFQKLKKQIGKKVGPLLDLMLQVEMLHLLMDKEYLKAKYANTTFTPIHHHLNGDVFLEFD